MKVRLEDALTPDGINVLLQEAINTSNIPSIEYFIKLGGSETVIPGSNTSVFYYAAAGKDLDPHLWEKVLDLGCNPLIPLSAGADPALLAHEGYVVHHRLARLGLADRLVAVLGRVPSGKDVRDARGRTPLHEAAEGPASEAAYANRQARMHKANVQPYLKTVQALVAAGADVNGTDNRGKTPLDVAMGGRQDEIADEIRRLGGRAGVPNLAATA
ncbi:hypothetical protein HK405_012408 [Cladochytrium tenue]|nr:hypothetical protein HK405_012408 [Cladochytrium tenue]